MRRIFTEILLWVVFTSAVSMGLMLIRSRAAYESALSSIKQGKTEAAVEELETAARWYFPGSPYTRASVEKLRFMAREEEMAGRLESALRYYRSITRALMSVRHVWLPGKSLLEDSRKGEARLMALAPVSIDQSGHQRLKSYSFESGEILSGDPSLLSVLLLVVGLAGWIGGTGGLALSGVTKDGRFNRQAKWWALSVAGGTLVWFFSLVVA